MPHPIKSILAFSITATIALFLVAKDKILPGQAGVEVKAEKRANDKTPTADQRRALEVLDRVFDAANRLKPDDQGWNNESFPPLARADFDRALRLAQAIKANEPAMLAQVAACRGILVQN